MAQIPPKPLKHFQVVEVRAGREWTLYVLDADGEIWCRYWIEKGYNPKTRYLEGTWGKWRRLADDDLA